MADPKAFHIQLDGEGYVLLDESYFVQGQRPFSPRFATGDPSYGDLSFWQFLTIEDFKGGEGQEIFTQTNKYRQSAGFSLQTGKPKIAPGYQTLTPSATIPSGSITPGLVPKTVVFNDDVFIAYEAGLAAHTETVIQTRDVANSKPKITHIEATDLIVLTRESGTTDYLIASRGRVVKFYQYIAGSLTTISSHTLTFGGASDQITMLAAVDKNNFLVAGTRGSPNSGDVFMNRITLAAGIFTVANERPVELQGEHTGVITNSYAVDSNGTFYWAKVDYTAQNLQTGTQIYTAIANDILGAQPRYTRTEFVPNTRIRSIFDLRGTVYYAGFLLEGSSRTTPIVNKYPATEIWRSTQTDTSFRTNPEQTNMGFCRCGFSMLMLTKNDMGLWNPVLEIKEDESVSEVASFAFTFGSADALPAIFTYDGRFFLIDPDTLTYLQTLDQSGGLPGTFSNVRLQLSDFGGNTPLINKSLYSVTLELSSALPAGKTLRVFVNGTNVGNIADTDGTSKEIILTSELTGRAFTTILEADSDMVYPGEIERVTLRYIPTQFKKRQWGLAIRAGNSLKLLSGQRDPRTSDQIFQDIITAWEKNTPISFTDVDGRTYNVIITDFKGRQPVTAMERDRREFIIPLELLEV